MLHLLRHFPNTYTNTHICLRMYVFTNITADPVYILVKDKQNPTPTFYPPTPLFFHSGVSFHGHICQPVTFNLSLLLFPIMASHCVLSPSLDTQWWKGIFSPMLLNSFKSLLAVCRAKPHLCQINFAVTWQTDMILPGKCPTSCSKRNLIWHEAEGKKKRNSHFGGLLLLVSFKVFVKVFCTPYFIILRFTLSFTQFL